MKANIKILMMSSLLSTLVACNSIVEDERAKNFATGLPVSPIDAIVENDSIVSVEIANEGLIDSDNDGVIDARDKCNEDIGKNVAVDNDGCTLLLSSIKAFDLTVQFASLSAAVDKRYFPEIKKLAEIFNEKESHKLLIAGHTDNIGTRTENKKLSLDRARAVASVLIDEFQIPAKDLLISGYGPDRPKVSNDTAEGRGTNRRIVAHFVYNDRIVQHDWNIWSVEMGDKEREIEEYFNVIDALPY
jgi:outer membrane protein OmpA-like peptidoglycan-associated protein